MPQENKRQQPEIKTRNISGISHIKTFERLT